MRHSHAPSRRAKTSTRAPRGEQPSEQDAAAKSAALPPRPRRPLRWADPADARGWLDAARAAYLDLAAAAREGTRSRKDRVLTDAQLCQEVREAEAALLSLLDAAEAGLPVEKGGRGA